MLNSTGPAGRAGTRALQTPSPEAASAARPSSRRAASVHSAAPSGRKRMLAEARGDVDEILVVNRTGDSVGGTTGSCVGVAMTGAASRTRVEFSAPGVPSIAGRGRRWALAIPWPALLVSSVCEPRTHFALKDTW